MAAAPKTTLLPGQIRRPDTTTPRAAQGFPHVAQVQDWAAQQTIQLLWSQIQTLQNQLAAAIATGTASTAAITALTDRLSAAEQTAQSALAAAGKMTSNLPQLPGAGNAAGDPGGGVGGGGTTLPPEPPNYLAYVQQAHDDLVAAAIPLTGTCGSFQIIKLATYRLRSIDPSVGLLLKPSGTNCDGYAGDIINFLGGRIVDAVADKPTGGVATWDVKNETRPANQWHAPIPGAIP